MKNKIATVVLLALILSVAGCGNGAGSYDNINEEPANVTAETEQAEASAGNVTTCESEEEENMEENLHHQVIVYFPNWNLGNENGNVSDIPWDKVTMINHAFWKVVPVNDPEISSFEQRKKDEGARTDFMIVSTDPEADNIIFPEYESFLSKYKDVKVMISIGGWSDSEFFSEMAFTEEGRKSFINSCMELMDAYPWIGGIDIDWEYPGGDNDGERYPEDEYDGGCPIFGTKFDDMNNFASLLKEMRETFDSKYNKEKLITACASASTGWTLPNQDWVSAAPYLDYINIMTYDMAGDWDGVTGHASSVAWAKNAMAYFIIKKIDPAKLNLGAAYYGTGFIMSENASFTNPVGQEIVVPSGINKDSLTVPYIDSLIKASADDGETGWHNAYDEKNGGAYLYNDDDTSEFYKWYISYENEASLQGKIDLIEKYKLAGIIVWEITQDNSEHSMTSYLGERLK